MSQGLAKKKYSKVYVQGMNNEVVSEQTWAASRMATDLGLMPSHDPVDTQPSGELLPEPSFGTLSNLVLPLSLTEPGG